MRARTCAEAGAASASVITQIPSHRLTALLREFNSWNTQHYKDAQAARSNGFDPEFLFAGCTPGASWRLWWFRGSFWRTCVRNRQLEPQAFKEQASRAALVALAGVTQPISPTHIVVVASPLAAGSRLGVPTCDEARGNHMASTFGCPSLAGPGSGSNTRE